MAIDTLAYVKSLEAAGVDRRAAEAHAEALTHHMFPDLATKDEAKDDIKADRHALCRRLRVVEADRARLTRLPARRCLPLPGAAG